MVMAMANGSGSPMTRRALLGALALSLTVAALGPRARAAAAPSPLSPPPPAVGAPAAVLAEAGDGRVLFERGGGSVRAPASMAKIMTMVLAVRALESGRVRVSDLVSASEGAYRTGGSQIWLEPGEVLPFGQLLTAVAVGSANDAAVAIAEHMAGSVPAFVAEMNAFAARLGMRHTRFVNPNGLDATGQTTKTTALDMARLAVYAARMPELVRLTSTREDRTLRNGHGGHLWLVNTNRLIGVVPGVDGLKTGFTNAAGYCLAATAERSGLRLVAVVMGAPSSRARFADATSLLNWGFAHYRAVYAAHRGERLATVAVVRGRARAIDLIAARDAVFTLPRDAATPSLGRRLSLAAPLVAPVRAGQVAGAARFTLPGVGTRTVPLVTATGTSRVGLFDVLRRLAGLASAPHGARPSPVA